MRPIRMAHEIICVLYKMCVCRCVFHVACKGIIHCSDRRPICVQLVDEVLHPADLLGACRLEIPGAPRSGEREQRLHERQELSRMLKYDDGPDELLCRWWRPPLPNLLGSGSNGGSQWRHDIGRCWLELRM